MQVQEGRKEGVWLRASSKSKSEDCNSLFIMIGNCVHLATNSTSMSFACRYYMD